MRFGLRASLWLDRLGSRCYARPREASMDKPQLIAAILTALFVVGLVAFRLLWAGSQLSAGLGLNRLPNRWVPAKLRRWLFGEAEPKPTR
jgi:hypothetical protein